MDLKGIVNGYTNRSLADLKLITKEKEEKAHTRLEICKKCPIFEAPTMKCSSVKGGCGCNMKTKVYCTTCTCPKNKW